jgi:DNA replication and repair protein RecF
VIEDFNSTFQPLFRCLFSDEELQIGYRPSWKSAASMEDCLNQLQSRRQIDREREATTQGPHRDTFTYICRGREFSLTASTGQIRLLSLVLKASQARYFQEKTGRTPLLLLDDVLLEVDEPKRMAFLDNLPEYEQAFFAFLPDEKFLNYSKEQTRFYAVRDGKISGWRKPEIS